MACVYGGQAGHTSSLCACGYNKSMNRNRPVDMRDWITRLYAWACNLIYNELAGQYDLISWLVSAGQWRRWQRHVWRYCRGQRLLDLGCGSGAMLVDGQRVTPQLVGLDLSPSMIAISHRRAIAARSHFKLVQGSGLYLPFADAAFDTVLATFPAGYILEAKTLAEVRRVLCTGGRFVALGLWVQLRGGLPTGWLPVFYGKPSDAVLARIAHTVAQAGFQPQWEEVQEGFVTIGILIAERGE